MKMFKSRTFTVTFESAESFWAFEEVAFKDLGLGIMIEGTVAITCGDYAYGNGQRVAKYTIKWNKIKEFKELIRGYNRYASVFKKEWMIKVEEA